MSDMLLLKYPALTATDSNFSSYKSSDILIQQAIPLVIVGLLLKFHDCHTENATHPSIKSGRESKQTRWDCDQLWAEVTTTTA